MTFEKGTRQIARIDSVARSNSSGCVPPVHVGSRAVGVAGKADSCHRALLLAPYSQIAELKRSRVPQHAFSETDRLLARPQDATELPRIRAALNCWSDWSAEKVTAHDGQVRENHPIIERALLRTQSATSLSRLLRDPLGFV